MSTTRACLHVVVMPLWRGECEQEGRLRHPA